jgi:chaperonin GroES
MRIVIKSHLNNSSPAFHLCAPTIFHWHSCQFQKFPTLLIASLQSTALKSIRSLAPLLDRVLVQRIKAETKTASGIFLPESSVKELNEARVLAVGPGGLDKDGKRVSCSVQAGDKVLIPQVRDFLDGGLVSGNIAGNHSVGRRWR